MSRREQQPLPPPLPPETRTVGQLVAETIRFYQAHFWQVLPLGLSLGLIEQVNAGFSTTAQALVLAAGAPLMAASYVRASQLVSGSPWSWTALAVGTLIFLPVPVLMLVTCCRRPGGSRSSAWRCRPRRSSGSASATRSSAAAGSARPTSSTRSAAIATLAILFGLTKFVLVLLLKGQADVAVRVALFLADVVLSPMLFVGAALLYYDQAARVVALPTMPLYILLSTLSTQGVQTLKANPDRLQEVNRDIEELGARVLHQWATLGEFDFVNVVEAPDIATVAKISIALGARGSTRIETLPALEIDELLSALND